MSKRIAWAVASAWLVTMTAWAGPQYESVLSTCTSINCAGMTIRGQQQLDEPFVIQVYAREGECLRLDVSTQSEDTALAILSTTVAESGFSDDVVDLRPVFGLDPVPKTGWYTVGISYFDYSDLIVRFTLEYGRYNGGNPNCSQATEAVPMAPNRLSPVSAAQFKNSKPTAD